MSNPTAKKKGQDQGTLVAGGVIGAIVLLVYLIAMGHHYLAPEPNHLAAAFQASGNPPPAWVIQDARQCNGDMTKLSADEQAKINAKYKTEAKQVISTVYAAYSN